MALRRAGYGLDSRKTVLPLQHRGFRLEGFGYTTLGLAPVTVGMTIASSRIALLIELA